jgi:hypothetical protein
MDEGEFLEADTRMFSGRLAQWEDRHARFITDSGLTVVLETMGFKPLPDGARVTVVTRKYLPICQVVRMAPGAA